LSYFLDKKFTKRLDEGRRIIPLIDHDNIDEVIEYIELLTSHKFSIFEYTLRHQHSIDHIKILRKKFPHIILGAGSIKDKKTISMLDKKKINFFVSPGIIQNLNLSKKNYLPGVFTPTEIISVQKLRILKLFPANILNITEYLKTLKGPFPEIKFIPTGGVNINNFSEILSHENVFAVAGSFMFPKNKNRSLDFNKLSKLIKSL
jgi:2-dehydro-3-deoxyphosphogluconate aldolase/(4S)-4-hydroxy-2-oxoglutarate aldolase